MSTEVETSLMVRERNQAIEQSVSSLRRLLASVATDVCADQV